LNGDLNCDELKTLLHPYVDGELDLVRSLCVERHVQECSGCAGALKQLQRLRQSLSNPQFYHRAGPDLRRRVLWALPQESRSTVPGRFRLPRLFVPLGLAASFLLVAFLTWDIVRSRSGQDFVEREVVSAYVRAQLSNRSMDVKSSDSHEVKPFFNRKVAFAPTVKDLTDHGYPLEGGRVDYVDSRTVAVLVYTRHKHFINLFVWPAGAGEQASRDMSRQGYNLIHWQSGGFTYWAISDLNERELREFAQLIKS